MNRRSQPRFRRAEFRQSAGAVAAGLLPSILLGPLAWRVTGSLSICLLVLQVAYLLVAFAGLGALRRRWPGWTTLSLVGLAPTVLLLIVGVAAGAQPMALILAQPAAFGSAVLGCGIGRFARAAAGRAAVPVALLACLAVGIGLLPVSHAASRLDAHPAVGELLLAANPFVAVSAAAGHDLVRSGPLYDALTLSGYRFDYPRAWLPPLLLLVLGLVLGLRKGVAFMPTLRRLTIWTLVLCVTLAVAPQVTAAAIDDAELETKVKRAMDRGLKWLRNQRQENGSWENHPGITALVLTAYARSHRGYTEEDGPFIRDAVSYLEALAKPDGAIYDRDLPVYNTAVSVMAFCSLGNRKHGPMIEKARDFLVDKQTDEAEGYKPDDKFYGGIGYGNDERPDLSNLQYAMEGLRAAGLPKDDPAWDRAIRFLERCQNRSESNDQAWAANDGGFVYAPGHSMAGGTKSYGSMTYAGIKSLIYANLEKDDPRVTQAMDWIREHYTLEENPGMGAQGLYYYYNVFAKAMRAHGDLTIEDASGKSHLWADELASEVLSRQYDDGFWMNAESGRWWEGNKVLVTAETVLTLAELLAEPGPPEDSCPALGSGGSKGGSR